MAKDPYTVLGVSKSASADDIRKAYRTLAKKNHPDLNPGNKAAEEAFKDVQLAFDILGDAEKRKKFDAGMIDANGMDIPAGGFSRTYRGKPGASGKGFEGFHHAGFQRKAEAGSGSFDDINDLFSEFFGQSRGRSEPPPPPPQRGKDAHYALNISFLEAAKGESKRVTMPDGKTFDVSIPEGLEDGQKLRLRGKGAAGGNGAPSGDAIITVSVAPHAYFTRQGNDIHLELPVTLQEAVMGASVKVPTLSGPVSLRIPKGANSGQTLRLKGKGIKGGNQLVTIQIVLPDDSDGKLHKFVEDWARNHAYNPRKKFESS